jgi:hypothetical protein
LALLHRFEVAGKLTVNCSKAERLVLLGTRGSGAAEGGCDPDHREHFLHSISLQANRQVTGLVLEAAFGWRCEERGGLRRPRLGSGDGGMIVRRFRRAVAPGTM